MEVKGSAVLSTPKFIQSKFDTQYDNWVNSLSEGSRKILQNQILPSSWYPIEDALVNPTKLMCNLFFAGDIIGAREVGKYSAEIALKGVYKLFVKVGSPQFIISRASNILSAYYRPGEITIVDLKPKGVVLQFTKMSFSEYIVESRIAGWMEGALAIHGCSNIHVDISKSISNRNNFTEMIVNWE